MPKRKKASPPNPNGREGRPISIPLPFEDALAAALETPPPQEKPARKAKPVPKRSKR